ncbi:calcium-transporting ATPase type 2C member 2 [Striga asiatica]|uniref:Calcium-transporting ATPase type 2C member 2 n=1 Tax=Striga asiatica TaxID=4170 RepID=A0A5A7Q4R4_STRAF|nr:calcium-transporting ATPase type 2C member 2 [Striga asiatica]
MKPPWILPTPLNSYHEMSTSVRQSSVLKGSVPLNATVIRLGPTFLFWKIIAFVVFDSFDAIIARAALYLLLSVAIFVSNSNLLSTFAAVDLNVADVLSGITSLPKL